MYSDNGAVPVRGQLQQPLPAFQSQGSQNQNSPASINQQGTHRNDDSPVQPSLLQTENASMTPAGVQTPNFIPRVIHPHETENISRISSDILTVEELDYARDAIYKYTQKYLFPKIKFLGPSSEEELLQYNESPSALCNLVLNNCQLHTQGDPRKRWSSLRKFVCRKITACRNDKGTAIKLALYSK
jgi:hypothetical protein